MRDPVDRGSIPYSPVTQPSPLPRRKEGIFSSTLAVQITFVSPHSIRTEPSAWRVKAGVRRTGRATFQDLLSASETIEKFYLNGVAREMCPAKVGFSKPPTKKRTCLMFSRLFISDRASDSRMAYSTAAPPGI